MVNMGWWNVMPRSLGLNIGWWNVKSFSVWFVISLKTADNPRLLSPLYCSSSRTAMTRSTTSNCMPGSWRRTASASPRISTSRSSLCPCPAPAARLSRLRPSITSAASLPPPSSHPSLVTTGSPPTGQKVSPFPFLSVVDGVFVVVLSGLVFGWSCRHNRQKVSPFSFLSVVDGVFVVVLSGLVFGWSCRHNRQEVSPFLFLSVVDGVFVVVLSGLVFGWSSRRNSQKMFPFPFLGVTVDVLLVVLCSVDHTDTTLRSFLLLLRVLWLRCRCYFGGETSRQKDI